MAWVITDYITLQRTENVFSCVLVTLAEDTSSNEHQCQKYVDECTTLHCPYGIEPFVDEETQCNKCRCHDPCKGVHCSVGTQCAIDLNHNRTSAADPNFVAVCRHSTYEVVAVSTPNCVICSKQIRRVPSGQVRRGAVRGGVSERRRLRLRSEVLLERLRHFLRGPGRRGHAGFVEDNVQ